MEMLLYIFGGKWYIVAQNFSAQSIEGRGRIKHGLSMPGKSLRSMASRLSLVGSSDLATVYRKQAYSDQASAARSAKPPPPSHTSCGAGTANGVSPICGSAALEELS